MKIESVIACKRLGAMDLSEETGFQLGMLWQPMMLAVSHTQCPPRQRLSSNAAGSRDVPLDLSNPSTHYDLFERTKPLVQRHKASLEPILRELQGDPDFATVDVEEFC